MKGGDGPYLLKGGIKGCREVRKYGEMISSITSWFLGRLRVWGRGKINMGGGEDTIHQQ